jgi:TorA maturation chaperone TorD
MRILFKPIVCFLMGEAVMRVNNYYQMAGFKIEAELPADFLGTELQFLAFLIEHHREQEELMHQVLTDMNAWIPKFATAVRIHAELLLYKDWAKRLEVLFSA